MTQLFASLGAAVVGTVSPVVEFDVIIIIVEKTGVLAFMVFLKVRVREKNLKKKF